MKIINFQAENFKRLKAVEIVPGDDMVVIGGKNGQGKTSVLDAIWLALAGAGAEKASNTKEVIRKGESKATVRLDLGEYIVTRKWTQYGASLTVESPDGARHKSPQSILDGMIGKISFDPLAFSQKKDAEQRETLLALVDLGLDLNQFDRDREAIYNQRTEINRRAKEMDSVISANCGYPDDTPDQEVSSADIMAEFQQASDIIAYNNRKRAELEAARAQIKAIDAQILELQAKKADILASGKVVKAEVEQMVDPDLEAIRQKLGRVEQINKHVRIKAAKIAAVSKRDELEQASAELTAKLQAMDDTKANALKSAKFPVEGLGFDESGVTFNGIPFCQCSSAERLRVSVAVAMKMNPKLRVLRVADASLLDSDSMKILMDMTKEAGYQAWIERVGTDGGVGVIIEDGEVADSSKPKREKKTEQTAADDPLETDSKAATAEENL